MLDFLNNEEYLKITNQFISVSKKLGERFDLVQAGGGNISFKYKDFMFIKSSGCNLTELGLNNNIVGLNYINIKNNFITNNQNKTIYKNSWVF